MLVTPGSERVIGSFCKGSLITGKLYFIDTGIQLKVLFYLLLPRQSSERERERAKRVSNLGT